MTQKKLVIWADEIRKQDILSKNLPADYCFEFMELGQSPDKNIEPAAYFILDEILIAELPFEDLKKEPLIFINSVVHPLSDLPSSKKIIRINAWPGFLRHPLLELSGKDEDKQMAEKMLNNLGWSYQWVADLPGLVTPRVISMIINEACYALHEKVSTPEEIDTALKLGTSYPQGPFTWSKQIGSKRIIALLDYLSKQDDRYLPAPFIEKYLA